MLAQGANPRCRASEPICGPLVESESASRFTVNSAPGAQGARGARARAAEAPLSAVRAWHMGHVREAAAVC